MLLPVSVKCKLLLLWISNINVLFDFKKRFIPGPGAWRLFYRLKKRRFVWVCGIGKPSMWDDLLMNVILICEVWGSPGGEDGGVDGLQRRVHVVGGTYCLLQPWSFELIRSPVQWVSSAKISKGSIASQLILNQNGPEGLIIGLW
jgi:hypothetical protein